MNPGDKVYVYWQESIWLPAEVVLVTAAGRIVLRVSFQQVTYPRRLVRTIEEHTRHLLVQ